MITGSATRTIAGDAYALQRFEGIFVVTGEVNRKPME